MSIDVGLGFVMVAMLILWFIIGSKGHWISKAVVILASLYFCLSVGFSIKDYMGWPTSEGLPKKFLVHWIVVEEPDKRTGDKGAVYVWLKPLSKTEKSYEGWEDYLLSFYDGESRPRAYSLSYTRDLHEKAQRAIEMIMGGARVGGLNGEGDKGKGKAKGKAGGKGEGGSAANEGGGSLTRNGGIMFHELPPPRLPDKGATE